MSESSRKEVLDAIRRVLDGDPDSYELVYQRHDPPLRAFICFRYRCPGRDFVDEVAIRSHERAFLRLGRFDQERASFQTWLNWQARAVAKRVRAEWFSPSYVSLDEPRHEALAAVPGPADECELARRRRVLEQELERLGPLVRECIAARDCDGLAFKAAAARVGVSAERLLRQRRRGLAVLRRRLQERGVSPVEVSWTPVPTWFGEDRTDVDDDFTASVTAILPDGGPPLHGAAEAEIEE